MPLSPPVSRQLRHQRAIHAVAYERGDGLWDVEACLTDRKPRDVPLATGVLPSGMPIHELWLRITIDRRLNIVDAEAATDWAPYAGECRAANPAYRALIGLNLLRQFRREANRRLAGTVGCTHLTELCSVLPTAAIQAFAGDVWDTTSSSGPGEEASMVDAKAGPGGLKPGGNVTKVTNDRIVSASVTPMDAAAFPGTTSVDTAASPGITSVDAAFANAISADPDTAPADTTPPGTMSTSAISAGAVFASRSAVCAVSENAAPESTTPADETARTISARAVPTDITSTRATPADVTSARAAPIGTASPDEAPPFQLGRCHALRFDGEAVRQFYPRWYGRAPRSVMRADAGNGKDITTGHAQQADRQGRQNGQDANLASRQNGGPNSNPGSCLDNNNPDSGLNNNLGNHPGSSLDSNPNKHPGSSPNGHQPGSQRTGQHHGQTRDDGG